jgi:hypothetical protein
MPVFYGTNEEIIPAWMCGERKRNSSLSFTTDGLSLYSFGVEIGQTHAGIKYLLDLTKESHFAVPILAHVRQARNPKGFARPMLVKPTIIRKQQIVPAKFGKKVWYIDYVFSNRSSIEILASPSFIEAALLATEIQELKARSLVYGTNNLYPEQKFIKELRRRALDMGTAWSAYYEPREDQEYGIVNLNEFPAEIVPVSEMSETQSAQWELTKSVYQLNLIK